MKDFSRAGGAPVDGAAEVVVMPGFQTMHWTPVGNVAVTTNGTTAVSIP